MEQKPPEESYEFSSFRLDVSKNRLFCNNEPVLLTPKEFELLLILVKNNGKIVEKSELLDRIWQHTFVEEGTLTRNISWLRKKLAASAKTEEKFIETIPKHGYRFVTAVTRKLSDLPAEQTVRHTQTEEIIEILPSPDEINITNHFQTQPKADTPQIYEPQRNFLPPASVGRKSSPIWILVALFGLFLISFAVYKNFFVSETRGLIPAKKIAPFTGLNGRETAPSFSPDGKQIVYSWNGGTENGKLNIYTKIIGAGEPLRLTHENFDNIYPVFSPDGKSIAFVRNLQTKNEIVLIPALGGAERKIDEDASFASISFSPDGNFLAVANLDFEKNLSGIYLINLATGEKSRITAPAAPSVDLSPRFSPDGKFLAFIRYFNSFRREIFIVPITGGEPRQITFDNARIYGIDWKNDGKSLFFTSFRESNNINLWQISLAEKSVPQMIPTGSKGLQSLAMSPDGKQIVFVEETTDENIWLIEQGKSPVPLIRSTRADHSPQFSPDGRKIVFASDRTGNYEIWTADADGKNQTQITDSKTSAGSPRFSPDGKFIVYDAQHSGGSDIYIISANGGTPRKLTASGGNNLLPAWSADGKEIFFNSNRSGNGQIWKVSANGGEPVQLTKDGAFEISAVSDGQTIIYSKSSGKSGLWQIKTDGQDEKPIPELAQIGSWRSWCVAQNGIFYTNFNNDSPFPVRFFDFASRQTKDIVSIEKPPLLYYSNLSVSADGKKILYAREDQSASSIMIAVLE